MEVILNANNFQIITIKKKEKKKTKSKGLVMLEFPSKAFNDLEFQLTNYSIDFRSIGFLICDYLYLVPTQGVQ